MKTFMEDEKAMGPYEFVYVTALLLAAGLGVGTVWIATDYLKGYYNADIEAGIVSSRTAIFMNYQDGFLWLLPVFILLAVFAWVIIRSVELHGEKNS